MRRTPMSYRELERILLGVGFTQSRVAGSHRLFSRPERGITIVLPISARRYLSYRHVAAVRRTIVESGIMSSEEFERALEAGK